MREDNVQKEDTCLRRWQDPGGQWELLFKAHQGHVTANGLEGTTCLEATETLVALFRLAWLCPVSALMLLSSAFTDQCPALVLLSLMLALYCPTSASSCHVPSPVICPVFALARLRPQLVSSMI